MRWRLLAAPPTATGVSILRPADLDPPEPLRPSLLDRARAHVEASLAVGAQKVGGVRNTDNRLSAFLDRLIGKAALASGPLADADGRRHGEQH
jgi:hypothetical protein